MKGESLNINDLSAIHIFCKKGTMLDIRINGVEWSIYSTNLTTRGWYLEEITLSMH